MLNWLALDNTRGVGFDEAVGGGVNGAPSVQGLADGVDDASEEGFADGDLEDFAGAADEIALADGGVIAEDNGTNVVAFQIHGHAIGAIGEEEHLLCHDAGQSINAGNTVAGLEDVSDFVLIQAQAELAEVFLEDSRDGLRINCKLRHGHIVVRCVDEFQRISGKGEGWVLRLPINHAGLHPERRY